MQTIISLLTEAKSEIKSLRHQNELMSARLEMFDTMMRLFHTTPNYGSNGMSHPDIVWSIEKFITSKLTPRPDPNPNYSTPHHETQL